MAHFFFIRHLMYLSGEKLTRKALEDAIIIVFLPSQISLDFPGQR